MSLQDNAAQYPTNKHQQEPVGGFIIDGQGREVPITEEMIKQACDALEEGRQRASQQA
ncbi:MULTISPECIES: PA1571 family protein [Pseudomonadaceae]|uniref:Multifunctional fatty acid oxidation complex subunit alpha n=1 Tax=Ectopseudomonas toyotomiensis TaxID=554344 RepID=A0A1I5SSA0_9GAMM|nr:MULTISPECIES: PA1571 family protein [Pseudomonas]MBG0840604.1 hypothetical protein [Pseudomonas toyotomiensis]MDH0702281.1 hypothetical protein [Pseudomonas toyotomiensis]SDA75904.1 hypothetical protein SAMN03159475_3813 [Pseudomonas sp. NFPP33]SFP73548.1 hypothetical protein SAMN05216177_104406 [Pseudomonas toyotomiensis]